MVKSTDVVEQLIETGQVMAPFLVFSLAEPFDVKTSRHFY